MKSTQLLSVVLTLIMFAGVTTGNAAFADSEENYDEFEDLLEDFCDMTENEQSELLSNYPELSDFEDRLVEVCSIEDFEERYDALVDVIDEIIPETKDNVDDFDKEFSELEDEFDETEDVPDDESHDLNDRLELFCDMSNDELEMLFADYPELVTFNDTLVSFCELSIDDREDAIDEFIVTHFPETRDDYDNNDVDRADYLADKYSNKGPQNIKDRFAMFCDMTSDERAERMQMHSDLPDDLRADLARYCEMTDEEQDNFRDHMMDRMDMMHDYMKDVMYTGKDIRHSLDRYCELSDEDKVAYIEEHDKDKATKMDRYCTLGEDEKTDFIHEHLDEYKSHMMDRMTDKPHMDYDKFCSMAAPDRALEITDVAKLDKISKWCDMTPEEREDFKREHHDEMRDKEHDRIDKLHDKMKFSDLSPRLKEMIKSKHDISDDRHDEIRMKYEERHNDLDKKKSELKIKFKEHMAEMKFKISEDRKSEIHKRLAEMKAFKAELREKASSLTDEQKQQLREDFIEKAKDMQLAWISPRTQMTAGVDAADVECREGFSLVMKVSNGVAMCLKADTALKMIDRGIVIPAN